MRLHILTACTRPESLPAMAASLEAAARLHDLTWHIRLDPAREAVGGQAVKNAMLDQIRDGWVYILDDDNVLHPAFADAIPDDPALALIVCGQQHRNGWVRRPGRAMLKQTYVDAGQVVIRRAALGALRIPLHYCGDGEWIEQFAARLPPAAIAYVDAPVTYYNWLRTD